MLNRVFERKPEYRYGCSIDCGGTPLRVYARELGGQGNWNSYEDYMPAHTFVWYNYSDGSSSDYAWLPGHRISEQEPPGDGSMYYQDAFGVQVAAGDFDPQAPMKRLPEYLEREEGLRFDGCDLYLPQFSLFGASFQQKSGEKQPTPKKETPFSKCLRACDDLFVELIGKCYKQFEECLKSRKPENVCNKELANCRSSAGLINAGCSLRCHDQGFPGTPEKPQPERIKLNVPGFPKIDFDPQRDYDKCHPDWGGKIPNLPKPPKT